MGQDEFVPEIGTPLRLRRLLEHRGLGLTGVAAVDPERRVRGAHSIEIADAGRWLPPGFVVLTTGLRFGSKGPNQRQAQALVSDLLHARSAALLFGAGVNMPHVPATLVQACEARGLPCLSVPAQVPFWQVEEFVGSSLRSADAYRLQRTIWLQNDLLDALGHDHPVTTIIARLAAVMSGTAVLYEDSGRIAAAAGPGPARLIWSELRARGLTGGRFRVGRWQVATRTLSVRGVTYVVALASRREDLLDDLAETLLETVQRLLAAVGGARALGTTQARADAAQLLATLQAGITPEEGLRIWERLRGYKFEPNARLRCYAAVPTRTPQPGGHPSGLAGEGSERLWLELHAEATTLGVPLLIRTETEPGADLPAGALWGMLGDSPGAQEWIESLARTHHVGLSEAYSALPATRARLREANRALTVAAERGNGDSGAARSASPSGGGSRRGHVVRFEDLDLVTWLLSGQERAPLAEKTARHLAAILDQEPLRATVVAYLANDLDVAGTAAALFLHPNSVRYRLRRVEELLGGSLTSPAVIANLYLALHDQLPDASGEPRR